MIEPLSGSFEFFSSVESRKKGARKNIFGTGSSEHCGQRFLNIDKLGETCRVNKMPAKQNCLIQSQSSIGLDTCSQPSPISKSRNLPESTVQSGETGRVGGDSNPLRGRVDIAKHADTIRNGKKSQRINGSRKPNNLRPGLVFPTDR